MSVIKLQGVRFTLRIPTTAEERRKLQWVADHYPVDRIREEAKLLLDAIICTARPARKQCERPARLRCYLCQRAVCEAHCVKVESGLGGSYYVCLICRWKSVPHLDRKY